jgi:hypothetical protein
MALEVYAPLGISLGAWVYSRNRGKTMVLDNGAEGFSPAEFKYDYDDAYEFNKRTDNRFEAVLISGAGLEFTWKAFSVFGEFRYNYSFTDLQKKYVKRGLVPQMNDTWTVSAGLSVNPEYWRKK